MRKRSWSALVREPPRRRVGQGGHCIAGNDFHLTGERQVIRTSPSERSQRAAAI